MIKFIVYPANIKMKKAERKLLYGSLQYSRKANYTVLHCYIVVLSDDFKTYA